MSKNKKSKYLNQKKDGIDSIAEGKRGQELAILQRVGKISFLRAQVHFLLIDAFYDRDGNKIQPCTYVADYVYEQD